MNLILTFGNPPHNDLIRHPPSGSVGSWGFTKMKILVKKKLHTKKINTSCCIEGIALRLP